MIKRIIVLLLIVQFSFAQDYGNNADALKLCVALQTNNFTTDAEAEDAVNKIMSVIGASQKPILQACSNLNNAVAAVYKGQRYILYDRDFMNSLTAGSNKYWSNMFILAHEMGHHINGHSLDIILYANDVIDPKSLEERRNQELEADEFAGFVLAKLGATLKETSLVMKNIPLISNQSTSTHPASLKRIIAARKGYKKGLNNIILENEDDSSVKENIVYEKPEKTESAVDYFNMAIYNQEIFKNIDAILNYTKAIELDPDFTEAYLKRASLKLELEDINGALYDYNKAIESQFVWYLFWIDYVDANTYYQRGVVKHLLEDWNGAIEDLNKAIKLDPNLTEAYLKRANAKIRLATLIYAGEDSEKDLAERSEMSEDLISFYKQTIEEKNLLLASAEETDPFENYNDAIDDYNKVIELDPGFYEAYFLKGNAIMERDSDEDLIDYYGAIESYNKAIEIYPNMVEAYEERAGIFLELNEFESALLDYTKIISLAPTKFNYLKSILIAKKGGLSPSCSVIFELLKIASKTRGVLNECDIQRTGISLYLSPWTLGNEYDCWDMAKLKLDKKYYRYYYGEFIVSRTEEQSYGCNQRERFEQLILQN